MILTQYYLGCLAHASYLVADPESRTAVVIDPQRDVDQYLADARQHGVEIRPAARYGQCQAMAAAHAAGVHQARGPLSPA